MKIIFVGFIYRRANVSKCHVGLLISEREDLGVMS